MTSKSDPPADPGLLAVLDRLGGVSEFVEHPLQPHAAHRIVLGHQDQSSRFHRVRREGDARIGRPDLAGQAAFHHAVKRRAPARLALHAHGPVHGRGQAAHDGQAQPGPLVRAGIGALKLDEGVKDAFHLIVGDAHAAVLDRKQQPGPVRPRSGQDRGLDADVAVLGIFHRVAGQVGEDLAQPQLVPPQVHGPRGLCRPRARPFSRQAGAMVSLTHRPKARPGKNRPRPGRVCRPRCATNPGCPTAGSSIVARI